MWMFFTTKKWVFWAYGGGFVILTSLWISVQIDVQINEWFGGFYDLIQKALGTPNAITMSEYAGGLISFAKLAALAISINLATSFLTSHFLFRWRRSMVDWYHQAYDRARTIEGASQRVQEDTVRFSRIMESLGTSFIEAIMVLIEFFPILLGLSAGISVLFFGDWKYGLVTGALIWTVGGTLLMVLLAWFLRLVGIEYDLQKKEAAYRKLLVIAEDDNTIRPKSLDEIFEDVKSIHYKSYFQYIWFSIGRLAYLQTNVLVGYIFLAPAIVAGVMTLGVMQQILRAFGRVESSMLYLFNSWPTIIELNYRWPRVK
jgi:peptide/bleomycin uptake transporter